MNPEIARLRTLDEKEEKRLMKVEEAFELWIAKIRRGSSARSSSPRQHTSLKSKVERWAVEHGIEHVQEITQLHMERWYSSSEWLKYAETTRKQRWSCLRSPFAYFVILEIIERSPVKNISL